MSTLHAKLIVCEKKGAWAAALRREMGEAIQRIVETRSLEECWDELTLAPASYVVCEATTANLTSLCERLMQLRGWSSHAQLVVAVNADTRMFANVLREAGAAYVVHNSTELSIAWRMAQKHFLRFPPQDESLVAEIWRRLPWSDAAESSR